MSASPNATAVYQAKANQVLDLVKLPKTGVGGFLQIIITILQQLFSGGTGGLGSCFGGGTPTPPAPPVLQQIHQAVTNPDRFQRRSLRGIVRHNVRQIGLRLPIEDALLEVGQATTPEESVAMFNHANGIAA